MARPTEFLNWMTGYSGTGVVDPGVPKKAVGWLASERPPYQYFNYAFKTLWDWISYLDGLANGTAQKTVSATGADTVDDSTILLDASAITRTLPTAVGNKGKRLTYVNLAARTGNALAGNSAQTFNGSAGYSLAEAYQFVTVESDNANWIVVGAG